VHIIPIFAFPLSFEIRLPFFNLSCPIMPELITIYYFMKEDRAVEKIGERRERENGTLVGE
jgi:hypothetical protein